VKIGINIGREYQIFQRLAMSPEDALKNNIVPIEQFISDDNGKQGILMPLFVSSLSCVNSECTVDPVYLEPAVLNGVLQIVNALEYFHAKGINHNDIKTGNIYLDFTGIGSLVISILVTSMASTMLII